jgi:diguanylate cyclase (GGDEF)-like protein
LDDAPADLARLHRAAMEEDAWIMGVPAALSLRRSTSVDAKALPFMVRWTVFSEAGLWLGWIVMAERAARRALSGDQVLALEDLGAMLREALEQARQHEELVAVTQRAARAEKMLQQVTESVSCEDALTRLLSELCRYHGASVGRIWRLTADETMHEVSRFTAETADEHPYYQLIPTETVRLGNSQTAQSIHANRPTAVNYSEIVDQDQYTLLRGAIAAGLRSQVSYPIWVQQQRFGVALAFTTERTDLAVIVADIASLSNTIRPALFRKVTEERMWFMAHHDDLTQLGNRSVFNERLAAALEATKAAEQGLALLYMDLDGFKLVNDTRGHEVGDKLLAAVAGRLRASVREGDLVARIGGDEFAVIHPGGQPYSAVQFARRLLTAVGQPFEIDGQRAVVGMSVGIALCPADGETPDVLQRHADAALYEAKQAGRNTIRLFEPQLAILQQERLLIERDLREAIEREEFTLNYQPIVEAEGLAVQGLEALLRWTHRTRGPLPPAKFVALAESTGLILPLGAWALDAACRAAAGWALPLCLSVNLSPLQFRQEGLARQIETVLLRSGLAPARLDLEVTEGLLLDGSEQVMRTMHELREMGVRMTLDDFGTAYASLSYLRRFPFDRIKIDRLFIEGIGRDNATTAIVEALLSLSRRLRLTVVAEGVETEAELAQLRAMGCGLVQGFLTGRPVPEEEAAVLAGGGIRQARLR